jgi:hypothetical protein
MPTNIKLPVACDADFDFARNLYFETMRWIIERLFGWHEVRENKNFAQFFKIDEVKIITADDQDVGWIQEQIDDTSINLGSILCGDSHAASGHCSASSSDIVSKRENSRKSNYPGCGKDQSGGPLLREIRISDHA